MPALKHRPRLRGALWAAMTVMAAASAAAWAGAPSTFGPGTPAPCGDEAVQETRPVTEPRELTREEGKVLLDVARKTIDGVLHRRSERGAADQDLPEIFRTPKGTFVTLTLRGDLRGCIGHILPQESLIEGIRVNAVNAAFRDPRFRPLSKEEWIEVKIEISILTEPRRIEYADAEDLLEKLRPDIDGVIIRKGRRQATFLPQVWEQLPGKEAFLNHLCLKAGLSGDAWRAGDLDVSTYRVQVFEE